MRADGRTGGQVDSSRRQFFAAVASALCMLSARPPVRQSDQDPDSLPGTGPSGRLVDPARAGRPLPPVTAADNDAAIQVIEKQLHCTCGCNLDVYTCRTTDFNCTVSPALHQRVLALAQQGMSGPQILDQFVRDHGVAILMSPPKRGFNLAGYFLSWPLAAGAAAVLTLVLVRRVRAGASAGPAASPPSPDTGATPAELARLQRELDRLPL